jgi:hypothetical protein
MPAYDFIDIDICVDCLMWYANADLSGMDDEDEILKVKAGVGIDEGYDVIPTGDGEEFFSHHPCDACRRPLGGSRHAATMMSSLPVPASP